MSAEYDNYLKEHIGAVKRAARWMIDHKVGLDDGLDVNEVLMNVERHDASKYEPEEYIPYDAYFYGDKDEELFDYAWLHHIHCNPHHWQYWLLVTDDDDGDEKLMPLEIPKECVYEMIADWWSFSWRSGDLREVFTWYADHRDRIIIHEITRKYVEGILEEIDGLLEEA